jgi:hypothetical protein
VPDTWTKWNLGDIWVRSLDYVTPTMLVAGSEASGVFTASSAAGPWTDISGNLSTTAKQVRQAVGQSGQIYLATSAGLFTGSGNGSWSQLGVAGSTPQPQRLDQGGVQSVVFPTGQPSIMVAATAGSGRDGVFWSSDSGVRWTKATGLTGATFYLTSSAGVMYPPPPRASTAPPTTATPGSSPPTVSPRERRPCGSPSRRPTRSS